MSSRPLPWEVYKNALGEPGTLDILDFTGDTVAMNLDPDEARSVVKAVNNHHDLVAALPDIREFDMAIYLLKNPDDMEIVDVEKVIKSLDVSLARIRAIHDELAKYEEAPDA